MPNPPKPNELKRKLGNPGKRPLPELKNIVTLPMASIVTGKQIGRAHV